MITNTFIGFLHSFGYFLRGPVVGHGDVGKAPVHGQADGVHILQAPPQGEGAALLGQLGEFPLQEDHRPVLVQTGVVLRPGDAPAAGGNDQPGGLAQLGQHGRLLRPEGLFSIARDVIGHGHPDDLFHLPVAVHKGPVQQVGQGLAHGRLAAAGHPDEDAVFLPAAQGLPGLLRLDGGDGLAREDAGSAPGLLGQHEQPTHVGDLQGLSLLHQRRAGGVIDEVQHPLAPGEPAQVHRGSGGVGVHPHGGGVHDHFCVGVLGQVLVVVRAGPGDHHDLPRPQLVQHILHRETGPAGAKHQALAPPDADAALPDQALEARRVRVVAEEAAVRVAHHGVHAANGGSGLGQVVAQGQHGGLIGNGDVQALKITVPDEVPQLVRGHFKQFVFVIAKKGMQLRGIAVAELFSQQSKAHQITSL